MCLKIPRDTKGQLVLELGPLQKILSREDLRQVLGSLYLTVGIPVVAFCFFLGLWSFAATKINTNLGKLPGPVQVKNQAVELWQEHLNERQKAAAFYIKQARTNAEKLKADPLAKVKVRKYTGKPTFINQIFTSLLTVFTGFFIASVIAIPIGIMCGLNKIVMSVFNPFIQLFKPISPLAWLPLVTLIVSAVYTTQNGMFQKCFLISAITVSLCSLWPTIINTAQGVASIDKDILNVSKVLNLGWFSHVFKIVLPSSLPLIFTGLRISLGVGWMVLIASEMLAQNPGLGKFVWDEFQNGSSNSVARIMVAIVTIGIIGFFLDRLMLLMQSMVNFEKIAFSDSPKRFSAPRKRIPS
jgi:nitrate/nitrite transport system permease protein